MPLRKVSRCHQDLLLLLYKVADKLNLRDIDYDIVFGTEDIDIFLYGTYKVNIRGTSDGQKVKYSAVIKWHPDPQQRACFREFYQREHVFYQRIVPELLNIQRQFNVIPGLRIGFFNNLYSTIEHDKECIVLQVDPKFTMSLDRFSKMDFAHASLVLKNLAKLHALSFVLERKNPSVFEEIKDKCGRDVQYPHPNYVSSSIKCYYDASVCVVSNTDAKEKLKAFLPKISMVLNKCVTPESHSVICHADCWNNNMLFTYQMGKPVDIIFVDYQLWRLASPVTDISYFFYMSTDRDFLVQYYNTLLEIYYGTLTGVLRQCDLEAEEVFPRHIFQKHLIQYSVFGLVEALVSMKIITAKADEACKLTEMKYHTEDETSENASQNHSLYVERVNGVVNDFFERGYSLDELLKIKGI